MLMKNLVDIFRLRDARCIALVGSGGKTSAMFRLAQDFQKTVWVSNTAHLAVEQGQLADRVVTVAVMDDLNRALAGLPQGVTLFTGAADDRGRTLGLDEKMIAALHAAAMQNDIPLIIEADGSRGLPLKAPTEWEPPIPEFVDQVIVTTGLSGLRKPLSSEFVYHPEIFGELSGLQPGQLVNGDALLRVILHPQGGMKNIPLHARKLALFNQRDACDATLDDIEAIGRGLLLRYEQVVISSLQGRKDRNPTIHSVLQPVAGILLAAGEARRMGRPKQLLDWHGEPLVSRVAKTALAGGLSPVYVVTGAYADDVGKAVHGLGLRVVNNPDWQVGQSSSVKAAMSELGVTVGAAVFLLCDQPFVSADLITALISRHARAQAEVVAPRVGKRRGNPVLFDRKTFNDLTQLEGDSGGRQVLARWPVDFVDWHDERILLDIDDDLDYLSALNVIND